MVKSSHFLTYNSAGTVVGNGYTPDGTFPPNSIQCTQIQYQNYSQYMVSDGKIVSAPDSVLLAQAKTIQRGIINAAYSNAISSVTISTYTLDFSPTQSLIWMTSVLATENALRNAPVWTANTAVSSGGHMTIDGELLVATVAGTTGTTQPTIPAIGETVTDGTNNPVTWELYTRSFDLGSIVTLSATDIMTLFNSVESHLSQQRTQLHTLLNQINTATTVAEVQAIVWPSS